MSKIKKLSLILLLGIFIIIPLVSFGSEENVEIIEDLKKELLPTLKKEKYKENQVIVKYKKEKIDLNKNEDKKLAKELEKNKELESAGEITKMNIKLLKSKSKTTEELITELEKDSNVEYVEPNYTRDLTYTPNDTNLNSQWGLNNIGQTGGTTDADIDAFEAWNVEIVGNEIIVAVIDTGARYTHEDLANNMWDGSAGCNDENNNPISGGCPNHGWDFENGDNDPMDEHGHGTFISGVIAGESNNSKGVSGMSRYNKIKIMPLRFGLDIFTEIKAINFAKNNGAKVINASFGGGASSLEKDAIDAFPGIFVAAAGNGGADLIGDDIDVIEFAPCDYTSANIICVTATDDDDILTSFSNYGIISVDLAAPGSGIFSASVSGDTLYTSGSGTSYAAPYVVGATALAIKQFPAKSLSEIKSLVVNSGDSLPSLSGKTVSGKRLNLNSLINDTAPPTLS
ncbi:MAG: S8 family serine peptidase, partial [Candidatus Moranbacteria bacterium]|nr:S8 family serine peptidase [Candidatus Moranbacteria bacterium]